jgi:PAS domain S-box-containing protein
MNVYSFLSSILFTVYLIIGFHVLSLDRKSTTHRFFFIICMVLSFLGVAAFFIFPARTKAEFLAWYRPAMLLYFFFIPSLAHFSLHLTSYIKKVKLLALLLYLPAIPFFIHSLLGGLVIYKDFIQQNGVWIFVPAQKTLWLYFYTVYTVGYHLLAALIMIIWGRKTKKRRNKRMALILGLSLLATPVIGAIENVILPLLPNYKSIGIGPLYYIVFAVCVWYSLVRYRFLGMTPELVGRDIASNIDESIILLDEQFRILWINPKTEALLGKKDKALIGRDFSYVFFRHEKLRSEVGELLKADTDDFSCRLDFKKDVQNGVLMDTKFSVVRDRFNDILGVLVLGREVRELKQLKAFYSLTGRELETIQCIINGYGNKEIAKALGIAERTVKTHLTNIYAKLQVANKVQLLSLLRSFNIISTYKASKVVIVDRQTSAAG